MPIVVIFIKRTPLLNIIIFYTVSAAMCACGWREKAIEDTVKEILIYTCHKLN